VIADPYEGPGGGPRWSPAARQIKALWFGNTGNMQSLIREVETLPAKISGYKVDLLVLTREFPGIDEAFRRFNEQHGATLTLRFREWSLERNWAELDDCDLVVLPVNHRERFYLAKGPNRLIEALWAGRFAVANSIPSYDEFSSWAWIGDIAEGMAWALEHPDDVTQQIGAAREHIRQRYSPAAIAAEWERALSSEVVRNKSGR
jgi:glycosyltransferase involved in cell wall biosynthesis